MKKQFDIEGLDCAVCASKLEDALKKMPGMKDVSVNFLMEKVTLDFDGEEKLIFSAVKKVAENLLPDVEIKF